MLDSYGDTWGTLATLIGHRDDRLLTARRLKFAIEYLEDSDLAYRIDESGETLGLLRLGRLQAVQSAQMFHDLIRGIRREIRGIQGGLF